MRLEMLESPAVEPVALHEAKPHLRVDIKAEDELISRYIVSAREYIEQYLQRSLIHQTWQLSFDIEDNPTASNSITLPLGTIDSINRIETFTQDNTPRLFDSSQYQLSGSRVVLNDGARWPELERSFDSLVITYLAGYGEQGSDVPQAIRQALCMLVAHYYENREASGDPTEDETAIEVIPFGVMALLQPYRLYSL